MTRIFRPLRPLDVIGVVVATVALWILLAREGLSSGETIVAVVVTVLAAAFLAARFFVNR